MVFNLDYTFSYRRQPPLLGWFFLSKLNRNKSPLSPYVPSAPFWLECEEMKNCNREICTAGARSSALLIKRGKTNRWKLNGKTEKQFLYLLMMIINIRSTDYGRPVRKSPSLHGRKPTPTPKFLGTARIFRFLWFMPSLGFRSPWLWEIIFFCSSYWTHFGLALLISSIREKNWQKICTKCPSKHPICQKIDLHLLTLCIHF